MSSGLGDFKMRDEFYKMVLRHMSCFFGPLAGEEADMIQASSDIAFFKTCNQIARICVKGYDSIRLYHTGHYSIYLYQLSAELSLRGEPYGLADRVYYLNKILHSVEVFHEVKLPELFFWEHPIGTVLGKAKYGERFSVYQGCTVGGVQSHDGNYQYPHLGTDVTLFAHSSIIGKCHIGDRVILASHTIVKNEDVPQDTIVFGTSPNLVFKENKRRNPFFVEVTG